MLTEREREVLSLACLSTEQIARKMNITKGTVQRVFADIRAKYGIMNRTRLLFQAIKTGELSVIDCGFFNIYGQYIEDIQVVNLKESGNGKQNHL